MRRTSAAVGRTEPGRASPAPRQIGRSRLAVAVAVLPLMAATAVAASLGSGTTARADTPAASRAPDKTSKLEAKRVDSVSTPKLGWYTCAPAYDEGQCAAVKLPRDYDQPNGPKVEISLIRRPALKKKLGTIFVNPGGPGGSAADMAAEADGLFGKKVLNNYDIVGIDPRGVGYSDQVQCFASEKTQDPVLAQMNVYFPIGTKETKRYEKGAAAAGKACSHHGAPLTGAASTAEDARDMDVIRRATGEKKLTYLGFSYGTYLGQVYANLFPDRVGSMVIDGVLDPTAWAGTATTKNTPQTLRVPSGQASLRAFNELLDRCDKSTKCKFKKAGTTSRQRFGKLVARLKKHNIQTPDTYNYYVYSYADVIAEITSDLYDPEGGEYVAEFLQALEKGKNSTLPEGPLDNEGTLSAAKVAQRTPPALRKAGQSPYGFPYDNSFEAFTTPLCTDSVNPAKVTDWPKAVQKVTSSAEYFGEYWAWSSAPCASSTWTIKDEDAYRGPFNKRTAGPVLVVGDFWDPATNYKSAVKVSKLLPNSRLLLSDSWGHTAYGTSTCVDNAVTDALISAKLPAKGTRCVGDKQPFGVSTPTPQSRTTADSGVDPQKVNEILRSHPGRY